MFRYYFKYRCKSWFAGPPSAAVAAATRLTVTSNKRNLRLAVQNLLCCEAVQFMTSLVMLRAAFVPE